MPRQLYRYKFTDALAARDLEESLLLAVLAAESLHGRERVLLDASFCLDPKQRSCVVDAGTEVGNTIARVFTGFLAREFGEQAFEVERVAPGAQEDEGRQSEESPAQAKASSRRGPDHREGARR